MHIGLRSKAVGGALMLALALAGCGGSSSTSQSSSTAAASASQTANAAQTSSTASATETTSSTSTTTPEKVPNFDLQLASSVKLNPIPARYTCDGANVSLPITWGHLPPNTAEIVLFLFNLAPIHGKLFASWAVSGLSPKLRGLSAGQLPAGAIVGRNGHGQTAYSVCPAKGASVRYAFLLYALPKKIPVKPGFDPEALREKALHVAESAGLLGASYQRQ
jgi:phosphatidylethanolamine-binding protein (PEBP) family uncharacterized protein